MELRPTLPLLIIFFAIHFSCGEANKPATKFAKGTEKGFELAKYHCSSCHSFVAADMLDRLTWKDQVLPAMAKQLGIEVIWDKEYIDRGSSGALITFSDWEKILDYYLRNAPEKLDMPAITRPAIDSVFFEVKVPDIRFANAARTVMVSFDTISENIYTGDGYTNNIYKWNNKLQLTDSVQVFSPPSSAWYVSKEKKRRAIFTTMGTMQATDVRNGNILEFDIDRKLAKPIDTIGKSLPRPVFTVPGDFNKDGRTDWVSCGFGRTSGGLYIFTQEANGKYSGKNIIQQAGSTKAIVKDFNNDGWDDMMVLFAHSEESIKLLINDQTGDFETHTLLSFPPVYGSTSFELVDFNNDGLQDILYTCGDNADISQVLKPFHGVYIFTNKGNNKYTQEYFYHINGTTKSITKDFDNDGDLDIATINFYADCANNPAETFVLLKNNGGMQFSPITPAINQYGRWLTMDAADYDRDGDIDLILGNFAKDFFIDKSFVPRWEQNLPIIILENKSNN